LRRHIASKAWIGAESAAPGPLRGPEHFQPDCAMTVQAENALSSCLIA
jgi:hypothetical protein